MPQITIYTTSWCAYCRAEKQFLDAAGVPYTAVDVEQDADAAAEMTKLSGQMGVPFTVLVRDDGTRVGILGFDQPRLSQELGIKEAAHPPADRPDAAPAKAA